MSRFQSERPSGWASFGKQDGRDGNSCGDSDGDSCGDPSGDGGGDGTGSDGCCNSFDRRLIRIVTTNSNRSTRALGADASKLGAVCFAGKQAAGAGMAANARKHTMLSRALNL